MFFYLAIYTLIILYGMIISSGYRGKTRNKYIFVGSFTILFTVQAFRSENIGEDLFVYVRWFKLFSNLGWENSFSYSHTGFYAEPGYITINLLIQSISKTGQALIVGSSLIILGLLLGFIYRNTDNMFDAIILFIGTNVFTNSMTALRQFFAMSIVFWIIPYLEKAYEDKNNDVFRDVDKNHNYMAQSRRRGVIRISSVTKSIKCYLMVLLFALLAFNFHKSSALFVLATIGLWILTRFNTRKLFKYVVIGGAIGIAILPRLLSLLIAYLPKYEIYFTNTTNQNYSLGKLRVLVVVIEILLIGYFYNRKDLHNRHNTLLALLVCMSAYVGVIGRYVPHIFRFGYYFDFFLILFIPVLIKSDKYSDYVFGKGLLFVGCTVLYSYYLATNAAGIVPYELFF